MRTRTLTLIAATVLLSVPVWESSAQTQAPAATVAARDLPRPRPPMAIRGFRSAHFGMNEAQVRTAIQKDFGSSAKLSKASNAAEGTTALVASLAKLDPGPGAARVVYVFGASSKGLIHVNVTWASTDQPNDATRQAMLQGGAELIEYFRNHPAKPKIAVGGVPANANGLVLYSAIDDAGASVEVQVQGIGFERTVDGKTVPSPLPSGPASLVVSYARSVLNPDIKTITPGAF